MNTLGTYMTDSELEVDLKCCSCGRESNFEDTGGYHFSVYRGRNSSNIDECYQHYDVCSLQCYLRQVKKSINNLGKSDRVWIDGMDIDFAKKLLFFYGIE